MSCDWKKDVAEAHYDTEVAEVTAPMIMLPPLDIVRLRLQAIVNHESCDDVGDGKRPVTVYSCIDLYAEKEVLGERDAW